MTLNLAVYYVFSVLFLGRLLDRVDLIKPVSNVRPFVVHTYVCTYICPFVHKKFLMKFGM